MSSTKSCVLFASPLISYVEPDMSSPVPGWMMLPTTRPIASAKVDIAKKYTNARPPILPTVAAFAIEPTPMTIVQKMMGAIIGFRPLPRRGDDARLEIAVADSGAGVPAAIAPRIFEMGFSTKPAGSDGRGVGLALARSIVDEAGGTIRLDRGRPTTFVVELPTRTVGEAADTENDGSES